MSFELRVEFAGLCLYVFDETFKQVAVLMPDCRKGFAEPKHIDGEKGAFHVGYIRYDLASVLGGTPLSARADAPGYEVVHKFDRELLEFGIAATGVESTQFDMPELEEFAPTLEVLPEVFGSNPPTQLLMRTMLRGGTLLAESPGDPWQVPGTLNENQQPYDGMFAGFATWSVRVEGDELPVTISKFDGSGRHTIHLRPIETQEGPLVILKVANLCAENPLEWDEFDIRVVDREDLDFRWLYRAMTPKPGTRGLKEMLEAQVDPASRKLPIPLLMTNPENATPQGRQNCFGVRTTRR